MLNKVNVLGVGFNPMTYDEIVRFLHNIQNRKKYICFPDIYNIIRANEDTFLKSIYNNSTLTLPDGKPSQFLLKKKGFNITTISGYWLCKRLLETNLTHYFYGSSVQNLNLLQTHIEEVHPRATVLGYTSPPIIREQDIVTHKQIKSELKNIFALKPDIIWVGISSPKQDLLMHYYHSNEKQTIMIGVGAVFDYFAGTAHMGPEWLKKIGLRWLYQLIRDPKRYSSRLYYVLKRLPILFLKLNNNK